MTEPALQVDKIKAALKAHPEKLPLAFDTLKLDTQSGVAFVGDAAESLTVTEAKLLAALMLVRNRLLTVNAALDAMYWDRPGDLPGEGAVHIALIQLRQKLKRLGYAVKNTRGFGWRVERGVT